MLLKYGYISEYDPAKCLARVDIPDMASNGERFVTNWLQVINNDGLGTESTPYRAKVRVALILDENCEHGIVLGGVKTKQAGPSITDPDTAGKTFEDGTEISYNVKTSTLTVKGPKQINIVCEKASIDAQNGVNIKGDVNVTGKIDATGNITTSAGDVSAGSTTLKTHVHTAPPGGGPTTPPTV